MELKRVVAEGGILLQKVPALSDYNCDGCFYKNLKCVEVYTPRRHGRLPCTAEQYIWEVADAAIDEG